MKRIFLVSSLLTLLTGCGGSDSSSSSTPNVTTNFSMTGSAQPAVLLSRFDKFIQFLIPTAIALPPPSLEDSNGTTVTLTEAWLAVEKIEFKANEVADESETENEEIEFEGPFYVDLLSETPTNFGEMTIPESGIRRIKMELHEVEDLPADAPAALDGKSIFFSGTVGVHNFTYSADDSTEIEFAGSSAVTPSAELDMLAVIKTAEIFKKIDLSAITGNTDIDSSNRVSAVNPCPLIDESADDLYTCFRKGLETESNFGNDDGDDDLDESDDTVEDEEEND